MPVWVRINHFFGRSFFLIFLTQQLSCFKTLNKPIFFFLGVESLAGPPLVVQPRSLKARGLCALWIHLSSHLWTNRNKILTEVVNLPLCTRISFFISVTLNFGFILIREGKGLLTSDVLLKIQYISVVDS